MGSAARTGRDGGRRRAGAAALLAIVGLVAAGSAAAGTASTTFTVTTIVNKNCLVTATALNFGTYVPTGGTLRASSTINVNCTKGTPFTVALNAGTTSGTTLAQRLLQNTTTGDTDTLQYNLYTSGSYGLIWGDGSGTSQTVAGTGLGVLTSVPETVYGQLPDIPANQNVSAGTYTDTITVTVTF